MKNTTKTLLAVIISFPFLLLAIVTSSTHTTLPNQPSVQGTSDQKSITIQKPAEEQKAPEKTQNPAVLNTTQEKPVTPEVTKVTEEPKKEIEPATETQPAPEVQSTKTNTANSKQKTTPAYVAPATKQEESAKPACPYGYDSTSNSCFIKYEGNGGGPTPCKDGTVSHSSGKGTCSGHGGIKK